jgi:zinc protease
MARDAACRYRLSPSVHGGDRLIGPESRIHFAASGSRFLFGHDMSAPMKPVSPSRAATVQKVVSKSGLEAWLVEDYAVPLVAFDFAFRGGATQDSPQKAGTATMLAALLDEGAGELDAGAFHRALDDKAVEISFSADSDNLRGRLKSLARNIDPAFELLRLAVNAPRLDSDAIERVRSQMIATLKRDAKDPDELAGKAWRQNAFPGHPYGRSSRGEFDTLAAITRDDLLAMRAKVMRRGDLKIAAVGAIDAARLAAALDAVFGDLPAEPRLEEVPEVTLAGLGSRTLVDVDVPQATIRFGLPGIGRHDADFPAAIVINHILGGGVFSARLFKEVREKRGLAYSVHSQLSSLSHAAVFSGGTSTKNERAAESLSVIEAEIEKLASEGPTEEELDKAKKYLIGSYALRFDTSTKIAANLVQLQIEGFGVEYLDERNVRIAAVTLDDAKRVAKRLFAGKKLMVAVAGRPQGM